MVNPSFLAARVLASSAQAVMDSSAASQWMSIGHSPNGPLCVDVSAQEQAQQEAASKPATAAWKAMMKLRKKLRSIEKIEELRSSGAKVDPLQLPKLEQKDEVVAQLQRAETAVAAEEAEHEEQRRLQSLNQMEVAQPEMSLWAQQQEACVPWCMAPTEDFEEGAPSSFDVEAAGTGAQSGLSESTRRRLRRQRAARRRPAAPAAARGRAACPSELGELTASLEAGGAERAAAVEALRGRVLEGTLQADGCRVVQRALEVAETSVTSQLLTELHGSVREAIDSPHGNYVIQKVVEVMPIALSSFVTEELRGHATAMACHRYGCRIICRLLEHSATSEGLNALISEVLDEAADLCRHSFGHYVIQSVLEHGLAAQRSRVAQTLCADAIALAQHRCASHVVEAALSHCSVEDQRVLGTLLGEQVVALGQGQFGCFVVKALLRTPGDFAHQAQVRLQAATSVLEETRHGQRLLRDLGLAAVGVP
mmetsp:Transcript_93294/g.216881  ORF Transcript_93294/g.216881 Transcript_93294/m.216881 type:complete len:481 (+) Transcript_93294:42-1484(+)